MPIDSSLHQRRFLECYAACGSVIQSARWAKLSRQAHYNWLKEDPTYRPRFEDAELRAAQTLQDEAVRRAHQGVRKAIYHRGHVVGYETEYSDRLMELMLKALNPEKFRERVEHSGIDLPPVNQIISIQFVIPNDDSTAGGAAIPVQAEPIQDSLRGPGSGEVLGICDSTPGNGHAAQDAYSVRPRDPKLN